MARPDLIPPETNANTVIPAGPAEQVEVTNVNTGSAKAVGVSKWWDIDGTF